MSYFWFSNKSHNNKEAITTEQVNLISNDKIKNLYSTDEKLGKDHQKLY